MPSSIWLGWCYSPLNLISWKWVLYFGVNVFLMIKKCGVPYVTWKPSIPIALIWSSGGTSEKRDSYTMAGFRLQSQTIDDSTIHQHLRNFYLWKGRKLFSRDNTHGKMLIIEHVNFGTMNISSMFTTCTRCIFGSIWNWTQTFWRYNY